MKKKLENARLAGYGHAIAKVARAGHKQIGKDLIIERGSALRDYEKCGLEYFDLEPIRMLFRDGVDLAGR